MKVENKIVRNFKTALKVNKGFSLLEILITIAVMAILATLVITQLGGGTSAEAKATKLQDTVSSTKDSVERFANDVGKYPGAIKYLWQNQDSNGNQIANWKGPYLKPDLTKDDKIWLKFIGDDAEMDISCTEGGVGTGKVEFVISNVPPNIATVYDKKFDDGDLTQGNVVYNSDSQQLTITITKADYVPGKYVYCVQ